MGENRKNPSPSFDAEKGQPEQADVSAGQLDVEKDPQLSSEESAFYETCPYGFTQMPNNPGTVAIIQSLAGKKIVQIIAVKITGSLYFRKIPK